MKPLTDENQVAILKACVAGFITPEGRIDIAKLSAPGFEVAAIQSCTPPHLCDDDVNRLSHALSKRNIHHVFAVSTGDGPIGSPDVYIVETTAKDLRAFNSGETGIFSFCMLDDAKTFVLILLISQIAICAGTRDFIEEVFGEKIEESRNAFAQYANGTGWTPEEGDYLRKLSSDIQHHSHPPLKTTHPKQTLPKSPPSAPQRPPGDRNTGPRIGKNAPKGPPAN